MVSSIHILPFSSGPAVDLANELIDVVGLHFGIV